MSALDPSTTNLDLIDYGYRAQADGGTPPDGWVRDAVASIDDLATVDGTVQQLAVNTVGGVVTPAQQLMVILLSDSRLEIEAMVQNKDIGFVEEGQEAVIKLEAFPFTKYGMIEGQVLTTGIQADRADRFLRRLGFRQTGGNYVLEGV